MGITHYLESRIPRISVKEATTWESFSR